MKRNIMAVIIIFLLPVTFAAFAQAPAQLKMPAAVIAALREKTIPQVEFRDADLESALQYVKTAFMEGDTPLGAKITLKLKPNRKNALPAITFAARNLSALEVLRIIAEQSETGVKVEPGGVMLTDADQTIQLPHGTPDTIAKFEQKLKSMILPAISARAGNVLDVLRFLSSNPALIPSTQTYENVNIVVMEKGMDPMKTPTLTYEAKNVPFLEALKVVCQKAGFEYKLEDGWIRVSVKKQDPSLMTVPPKVNINWNK